MSAATDHIRWALDVCDDLGLVPSTVTQYHDIGQHVVSVTFTADDSRAEFVEIARTFGAKRVKRHDNSLWAITMCSDGIEFVVYAGDWWKGVTDRDGEFAAIEADVRQTVQVPA